MRYTDFRNNLDVHPISGDVTRLIDEAAISNEIKNLLFTNKYERFWDPEKGAGISETLFDVFDDNSAYMVKIAVEECIRKYVGDRAALNDVIVKANLDRNQYELTVIYTPKNMLEPITLNTILKRIR